ncbi:hypothetical protein Bca52824_053347 [Brassica carinata]|uniref:Uncharacterized protein n=1 Tax=Brassica carinata TaxID=52824 RepID=A0A8X7R5Q6_BRACI|nr:hypothetical protein Bca52824_053347 [Brassica carinata]
MILFRPVVYSPLYQYILACLAVSNFNVLVSSRMNLELPVFDGFRCHYRLLRVQVKLISELVNGCLKDKFMFWDWSIFYSNHKYILACLAVSNFNVLVSSRMNLELPVFDGFRCHYRLLRVQVKLISELVNGCLKDKFMFWDWSIFYSNHKEFRWCKGRSYFDLSVELIMDKLQVPSSSFLGGFIDMREHVNLASVRQGHMNLAFVRIWSETCPSDCEGTVCRATHSQSFAHQTRDCSSNGEVWGYGFLMTCSKISKHVFSSNMQGFGNLRSLNLTSCKRPTQFPDLLKATNLEAVKPSSCVNWEV